MCTKTLHCKYTHSLQYYILNTLTCTTTLHCIDCQCTTIIYIKSFIRETLNFQKYIFLFLNLPAQIKILKLLVNTYNIFLKFQGFEIARLSHDRKTYLCQCVKHYQHFWKALGISNVQW